MIRDTLLPKLLGGLVALFIGGSLLYLEWQKGRQGMERIRSLLLEKGCREIVIHYEWFDFDKSNSTYTIECLHPANGRIRTVCKIHGGKDIYWKEPL